MKFSQRDLLLAGVAQFNREASIRDLAKLAGLRTHEVQYSLRRMTEAGVLRPWVFVNPYALGFEEFEIFFAVGAASRRLKQAFDTFFKNHPAVIWYGTLGGSYQYGVRLAARRASDCSQFIDECQKKFGDCILSKSVANILSFRTIPKRYLAPGHRALRGPGLTIAPPTKSVSIDDTDRRILKTVLSAPGASEREISRSTGLARNTIRNRLDSLRRNEVILPPAYLVSGLKLGRLLYRVIIFGQGLPTKLDEAFKPLIDRSTIVVNVTKCLGEWDLELVLEVADGRDASDFVGQAYEELGQRINRIELVPVFEQNVSDHFLDYIPK